MDRFFVGLTLCACLCLAPLQTAKPVSVSVMKEERALFSVLYPRFIGKTQTTEGELEGIEWYSWIVSFLRGEIA